MENQKRELTKKDESAPKKERVAMLEVKFKLNIKEVIEKRADSGNVYTVVIQETRHATRGT